MMTVRSNNVWSLSVYHGCTRMNAINKCAHVRVTIAEQSALTRQEGGTINAARRRGGRLNSTGFYPSHASDLPLPWPRRQCMK